MFLFRPLRGCAWLLIVILALAALIGAVLFSALRGGVDLAQSGARLSSSGEAIAPASLNSVYGKMPLFANVPLPQQANRDFRALVTNAGIAAGAVGALYMIGIILSGVADGAGKGIERLLRTVRLWLAIQRLRAALRWTIRRHLLTLPIFVLIYAVMGVLFATSDRLTPLTSPAGIQLALVLAAAVGVISLGADAAIRLAGRFSGGRRRYGARPSVLLLAGAAAVISRVVGVPPGLLFAPLGDLRPRPDEAPRRGLVAALLTPFILLAVAALGWLGVGLLAEIGRATFPPETLNRAAPLASLLQTFGFAIFVMGTQTAFFVVLPLGTSAGGRLFALRKPLWAAAAFLPTFALIHLFLNPIGMLSSAITTAPMLLFGVGIVLLALVGFGLWFSAQMSAAKTAPGFGWYSGTPSPLPLLYPHPEAPTVGLPATAAPPLPVATAPLPQPPPPDKDLMPDTQSQRAAVRLSVPYMPYTPHPTAGALFPPPTPDEAAELAKDAEFLRGITGQNAPLEGDLKGGIKTDSAMPPPPRSRYSEDENTTKH
ncbi:MAG: hypothetical protein HS103_00075 [Anaerolineales bacterium]|nr:hypothetical protein [Anaerolineales bacterium]